MTYVGKHRGGREGWRWGEYVGEHRHIVSASPMIRQCLGCWKVIR